MRKALAAGITAACFTLCVGLVAEARRTAETAAKVRIRLLDADTGKSIPGIVRAFREGSDKPVSLPGLYDRLRGLKPTAKSAGWHVVPATGEVVELPKEKLRFESVSGLETAQTTISVDLSKPSHEEITIRLQPLFKPEESGLVAGNTHLHLMNLTAEDSDEYLKRIPAADRLQVLFISYLERIKEDANYITNRHPVGDLKQFGATGVLVNNGEEHRHNFGSHGEGYGHVLFLNINSLVKPVSLGSGITGSGNDDIALRPGIENARKQGGLVLWCHNASGFEGVPNVLAGRVDALNVFDGTRAGTYEESYYRYLNIGLRFPISTGTDWFVYDFSRNYAKVSGEPTIPKWLAAVKAGQTQATNGPLISLKVDGHEPGNIIKLDKPKTVRVEVTAIGRHDFQKLQLVQNGRVIHEEPAKPNAGAYSSKFIKDVRLDEPAWFAARIDSTTTNELDRQLFAHTAPVYADYENQRVFDIDAAILMRRRMEFARDEIRSRGKFADNNSRDAILAQYTETAAEIDRRIAQRGK